MAKKIPGKGTLLQHGIGSPTPSYTTIASRVSIDGPDTKVGTVKVTDLDSTAEEYIPTITDSGELSLTIMYDPADATHVMMRGLLAAPSVDPWKLVFTNSAATAGAFNAILTGFKPNGMEVDGCLGADIKLQITGAIAWT